MNPWEEYASPTQEAGPWTDYQVEGPWSEYKQEVQGQDPSIGGVLADLAKQPFYAMRGANVAVRQALGDVLGDKGMQERAQQEAKELEYQRKAYSPQFESETARGLYSGAQSLARQGPAIAVGLATGGTALPLAMLGADTGGEAYTKYRGRGAEPGMAALGAAGEAGTEVATELLPMGFLVKKFGKVGFGQFLSGLLAREIPSEQAAVLVQDAIDTAIANPNKTWAEYVAERPGAMYQTLLATVSQAGLMAGASKAGQKYREYRGIKDERTKVNEGLDIQDLQAADLNEALKQEGQGTIYVGEDQIASDTLGTRITEDPAVTDYARAQVQDRLGEQPSKKFSYWEPNQQEMFPPISGPYHPDAKSAGQQSLDLKTPPDGLPPEPPAGGTPGAATYNEGQATEVKSTVASDAQANMLWHDHQAKVARNKGYEDIARMHEQKSAEAKRLFEQASKEYRQEKIESSNPMRTEDDITLTREKNNFVQEMERHFAESGEDPAYKLVGAAGGEGGVRTKIEAALEAAIAKVRSEFYYEFLDRYGLRDQWGREDVGPEDTRMDRNKRLVEDAKKAMVNLDEGYVLRQAMANIREALKIEGGDANTIPYENRENVLSNPDFRKWFGKSQFKDHYGVPKVFYHGTGADIEAFKNGRRRGLIFFSPSPSFAESFVPIPDDFKGTEGGSIYPVYLRAENVWNFDNEDQVENVLKEIFDKKNRNIVQPYGELDPDAPWINRRELKDALLQGDWGYIESPLIVNAIKSLGYDALSVYEGGEKNFAVFDPSQIKSATGNRGTFDPNESNINLANPEVPSLFREIESRGKHVTEADFEKAMAKKLAAKANQGLYTNAQKAEMMKNPRKHLTEMEVQTILGLIGPASFVRYDPQTLKSYEQNTGEFDGIELLNLIKDDPKFRGYTKVIDFLIKYLKRHKDAGTPVRWALDRNPDGSIRQNATMRGGWKDPIKKDKWDVNIDQPNFGSALYDIHQHTIWLGSQGLNPATIMHEALHAVTVRLIDLEPNHPAVKALKFIYDSVKNDPIFQKSDELIPEYGLKNLKEFLSEAFSNPRFQMKLLMHEVKGLSTSAQNAVRAIAEQVRRLLGIPTKDTTNTLEELMLRTEVVAEELANRAAELEKTAKKRIYPTRPIQVLDKYVSAAAKHKAMVEAYKVEQQKLNQIIGISKEGIQAIQSSNPMKVDSEDAKAEVLKDTIGIEYVAKDPVVDDTLIAEISLEEDGSPIWAMTPGALARSFLANSTLVRTGYRLLDNAAKRIALRTKQIVDPVEKNIVKLLQSDQGAILSDVLLRELRNNRDYTTDELRAAGVSDEVIMAHLEFRAMMQQILDRMNVERANKELPPISRHEAFVSARWAGPWRANIRDADGKIVWQVAEQNKWAAKRALDYIMERQPGLKADEISYREGREKGDDIEASYLDMLELLDKNDPRVESLRSIYQEYVLGRTEDVAAQEKHFIKKTGVRGFAGDRPWAKDGDHKQMFIQQFEYAKNALRWAEYQQAVDKLKPLVNDPILKDSQKNNIAYLREYSKNHLGFGTVELANKIDNWVAKSLGVSPATLQSSMGAAKTYFYLSRLGLSVPFTITQFIQPALTTPAWHADLSNKGYWHNPVRTSILGTLVGVEAATWHYMRMLGHDPAIVENLMDSVDKDAARWMEANGIVEINPLADIKRDLRPQAVKTVSMPFEFTIKHSEIIARSVAFMSFVQHLKQSERFDLDSAKGRAELFQMAEDLTKVSMTDYRSTERALIFERGGLTGDAAATLHSYQLNNLFQLWNFTKEFKNGNRQPLMIMMFQQFAMAGMAGLWFIDDLDDLWENFKKMLPHDEYEELKNVSIKGFMLEHFNDLVSYGLVSKVTGTNLHTRMSAADQIPFLPFEQVDLSSAKGIGQTAANTIGNTFPFLGTTGNLIDAATTLPRNVPERQKWEAGYAAAPAVAQGPMENLPAFNRGAVSKRPSDLGLGERKRTEEEKSLRNFGFRSIAEQKEKDRAFLNSKLEKELARRMQKASGNAKDYFLDKDVKKGVEELRKYVDLGGDPSAFLAQLPRAQLREATTEIQRRALEASTRAGILKLKRYLENVNEKATPVPTQ